MMDERVELAWFRLLNYTNHHGGGGGIYSNSRRGGDDMESKMGRPCQPRPQQAERSLRYGSDRNATPAEGQTLDGRRHEPQDQAACRGASVGHYSEIGRSHLSGEENAHGKADRGWRPLQ